MTKHSAFDVGLSSAEIIARRLPMIWWGMMRPSARSQSEMVRMVVEKQVAFAEACFAVQSELMLMMLAPLGASHERLMQAALAPSARRVKANLRRLRG